MVHLRYTEATIRIFRHGEEITAELPETEKGWRLNNYEELVAWLKEHEPVIRRYRENVRKANEGCQQICKRWDVIPLAHPISYLPFTFDLSWAPASAPKGVGGTRRVLIAIYIDSILIETRAMTLYLSWSWTRARNLFAEVRYENPSRKHLLRRPP